MAKAKKISINAFEKAVKENFQNTVTEEWNGLDVTVTHTIPLQEVITLVAEVTDNCFLGDGRYVPEVMQALLDCCVVEHYTNISLPSKLEVKYELVARSDIMNFIMPRINTNQYNDIVVAIRDKIDYLCDSNTMAFNHVLSQMSKSMEEVQESAKKMFDKIAPLDDTRSMEERVVDEYIKKKNDALKIVGDE